MVADLLHGIQFFFGGVVFRIIKHPVHRKAIVRIDRCLLTQYGSVHVKGGNPVCRLSGFSHYHLLSVKKCRLSIMSIMK